MILDFRVERRNCKTLEGFLYLLREDVLRSFSEAHISQEEVEAKVSPETRALSLAVLFDGPASNFM